jgi:hypothetical protein
MARFRLDDDAVEIDLSLVDELLSIHGRFRIAYPHIRSVSTERVPDALFRGVRFGTNLPGVKVAGTFIGASGVTYYDFHDPDRCITLVLSHDRYAEVVVEVDQDEDPAQVAGQIRARLGPSGA